MPPGQNGVGNTPSGSYRRRISPSRRYVSPGHALRHTSSDRGTPMKLTVVCGESHGATVALSASNAAGAPANVDGSAATTPSVNAPSRPPTAEPSGTSRAVASPSWRISTEMNGDASAAARWDVAKSWSTAASIEPETQAGAG